MSDVAAQRNDAESLVGRTPPEQAARVAQASAAARAPWYSRPIQLIVVCGLILIVVVMAVTSSLLSNLRDRDLAEKERDAREFLRSCSPSSSIAAFSRST